jgi:hypothetical protein
MEAVTTSNSSTRVAFVFSRMFRSVDINADASNGARTAPQGLLPGDESPSTLPPCPQWNAHPNRQST